MNIKAPREEIFSHKFVYFLLATILLAALLVWSLGVLYFLGCLMQNRVTGIIAAAIGAFSYYIVLCGRWLSNPTPILLSSVLLLLAMWKIITTKDDRWWLAVALLVGISLQFESASAIFYIPMVGVFFLWSLLTQVKS